MSCFYGFPLTEHDVWVRNGYQWMGKGRWVSMTLRRPKKKGGSSSNKMPAVIASVNDGAFESDDEHEEKRGKARTRGELDPEDPDSTIPLPRYNAMLAVIRNTLYMSVSLTMSSPVTDFKPIAMVAFMSEVLVNILWMIFIPSNWIRWIVTYA